MQLFYSTGKTVDDDWTAEITTKQDAEWPTNLADISHTGTADLRTKSTLNPSLLFTAADADSFGFMSLPTSPSGEKVTPQFTQWTQNAQFVSSPLNQKGILGGVGITVPVPMAGGGGVGVIGGVGGGVVGGGVATIPEGGKMGGERIKPSSVSVGGITVIGSASSHSESSAERTIKGLAFSPSWLARALSLRYETSESDYPPLTPEEQAIREDIELYIQFLEQIK